MVKNWPAMQESQVWSFGQEDPLEKGMATHSSILAQRIPWIEEPWWVTVHGVAKSWTQLRDQNTYMAKIHMEPQNNLNSQNNCKTKPINQPTKKNPNDNEIGCIILLNCILYCKATVIKMALYSHIQSMEQNWDLRNKPHTYGQLTHDKVGKYIQ